MLEVKQERSVLHVWLNRPEVRNAFNSELVAELTRIFSSLDSGVRAVVLGGRGKVFCAGGDLAWMREAAGWGREENVADALRLAELFDLIRTCRPFVICRVHGAVFGGGCGLVAAADYAVAAEDTRFSFSEVKLGLVPATISRVVLPKIGSGHARATFASGVVFKAPDALRMGLVHQVVEEESLELAIEDLLKHVLASGPQAVHRSKLLAQEPVLSTRAAAELLADIRASDEAKAGLEAFLEKRPAPYVEER